MPGFKNLPHPLLKGIHYPPRIAYALGLGPVLGKYILLLTTTGRSSGKKRVTPLQYEEIDGKIYLGSALGRKSDWVKNILVNSVVNIQLKSRKFTGNAVVIDDPAQIIEYLLLRYNRHPKMVGRILKSEGISLPPTSTSLREYANGIVLVVVDTLPSP